jgi:hypothetical protein
MGPKEYICPGLYRKCVKATDDHEASILAMTMEAGMSSIMATVHVHLQRGGTKEGRGGQ